MDEGRSTHLIDIEDHLRSGVSASTILPGFARVKTLLRLMASQLSVLDTMTPAAYAEIRRGLGQGRGQNSPGYGALLEHARALWPAFQACFPPADGANPAAIYRHSDTAAFAIAEAMIELDIGLARFRYVHLQLVDRMIGLDSQSLKGLPAAALTAGVDRKLFGELWAVRGNSNHREPMSTYPGAESAAPTGEPRSSSRRNLFASADWP